MPVELPPPSHLLWQLTLGALTIVVGIIGYLADHRLNAIESRLDAIRDQVVQTAAQSEANRQVLEYLKGQK